MTPRQLLILAGLLAMGAVVTAVVPKHPLFNAPGGIWVLGGMALFAAALAGRMWYRAWAAREKCRQ
jgi:hypothetical protein